MIPESLVIMWENTSAYYVLSCVVSIAAVVIAYQFTKDGSGRDGSSSSARDKPTEGDDIVKPSYIEDDAAEVDDAAAGDTRIERVDLSVRKDGKEDGGGDEKVGDEEEGDSILPDLLLTPSQIPDDLKKAKEKIILHQMQVNMSEDQKIMERKIQREQLSEIFKLVEEQGDKYGISSLADMEEQMKLYTK